MATSDVLHNPHMKKNNMADDRDFDRTRRRNSTGRMEQSKSGKSKDRLRKEQFLQPNSDQIDLNALLQAVLDINDKLQEQESKRKTEDSSDDDGASESTTDDSKFSRPSSSRPRSAKMYTDSKKPPLERKNMSFCNDRVEQIDRENQRLLSEITRRRGRPKSSSKNSTRRLPVEPVRVQTAAEVNRQRFQRKVDMENQQILRRLQNVRPTKTLSRDHLLREHITERQYASNASRSRPSSARHRRAASLSNLNSCASSETSLDMRDNASIASSRASNFSRRSGRSREIPRPQWEPGF